jgi:hypothetical protein
LREISRELSAPLASTAARAADSARRRRARIVRARRLDRFAETLVAHAGEEDDLRSAVARRMMFSLVPPCGPKKDKLAHRQTPTTPRRRIARRAIAHITLGEG